MVVITTIANIERHCLADNYNTNAFGSTFAVFPTAQKPSKKQQKSYQSNTQQHDSGQTNNDRERRMKA